MEKAVADVRVPIRGRRADVICNDAPALTASIRETSTSAVRN